MLFFFSIILHYVLDVLKSRTELKELEDTWAEDRLTTIFHHTLSNASEIPVLQILLILKLDIRLWFSYYTYYTTYSIIKEEEPKQEGVEVSWQYGEVDGGGARGLNHHRHARVEQEQAGNEHQQRQHWRHNNIMIIIIIIVIVIIIIVIIVIIIITIITIIGVIMFN